MIIFWKIDVSKEGLVKPSLELLMKMPDQGKNNSQVKKRGIMSIQLVLTLAK